MAAKTGFAGRLAAAFIASKLTPLIIAASILLGIGAVQLLPREEEPQIIVPMIDVLVRMPGASAGEVEERVTKPMEKLLWEIPGVEYIYSTSSPGFSMAVVRFTVGEDEEGAIVRTNQKLFANFDLIPPGASQPIVKPRSIDDVPVLALTLSSERYDPATLRRIAAQLHDTIKEVPDVSEVRIIGGQRRQVSVTLDGARMAALGVAPAALMPVLEQANQQTHAGSFSAADREYLVETGGFLTTAADVGRVVIGVHGGRPVFLRDVAAIEDGPEEPADYVRFGLGPAAEFSHALGGKPAGDVPEARRESSPGRSEATVLGNGRSGWASPGGAAASAAPAGAGLAVPATPRTVASLPSWATLAASLRDTSGASLRDTSSAPLRDTSGAPLRDAGSGTQPAVTLSVAKRKGTNATVVADNVLEKVRELEGTLVPGDVRLTVTRNYGETAREKSNELLYHMLLAIISVSILIWLALGLRESGIVAIAIPVTLALTLLVFYLYGYTLNRVTLFALIFSIGILVDDAIVVVENIVRHFRLPQNAGRPVREIAVEAVDEVGNPTILATFAVIAAILPMAFVRGLMGPYMRPIPVGASAAMLFSLVIAFVVTPWASLKLLRRDEGGEGHAHGTEDWTTRLYRRFMRPLLLVPRLRTIFLSGVVVLLLLACLLVAVKLVTVKMLPFDNKSEFQIVVDMPEGSTLERTYAATREIATAISVEPEVTDYQVYVGTASPYNFNGLVRHSFMRQGPNVADIQVNLAPKEERDAQSHDVAKRVRPRVDEIGRRYGARVKVSEVPPGPPVLQTLVAEVYGPDAERRTELARQVREIFERTEGVVDVDWYVEDDQPTYRLVIDREKAALAGITPAQIAATLEIGLDGAVAGLLHQPREKEDVPIVLKLRRDERSSVRDLRELKVLGTGGALVPLGEIVQVEETVADKSIYHKNLMPVVYVTGDVAGREESPVYAILKLTDEVAALHASEGYEIEQYTATQPFSGERLALKWDGEWHITYEVFRDLGIAFAAVLVLIYILVVGWFQSLKTPLVIMAAIPFSLVGILPAHWAMGAFFTATSMIGFIAGAGIVVRNSIILVDFVELRLAEGMPLVDAVVDAGAVRFRPMLLTAAAVVVGASVILFDPIFQGLAISLMAGEVASLLLSRVTVPILYYLSERRSHPEAPIEEEPDEPAMTLAAEA